MRARIDGTRATNWTQPPNSTCAASTARGGGGPLHACAPDVAPAPGRVVRDRPATGRMASPAWSSWMNRSGGAGLLQPPRLPRSAATASAAGTAAVLLQQPGRRLPRPAMAWACEEFFDPARVVAHPHLSLAGGAVRGWDRRNAHYFQLIQSPRAPLSVSTSRRPGASCREQVRKLLLHGSGNEEIDFTLRQRARRTSHRGATLSRASCRTWSGAIARPSPHAVREELAKYLGARPCPDCGGTRLNRAARSCSSPSRPAGYHAPAPWATPSAFFDKLDLPGWRGEIAAQDRQGDPRAAALPGRCRAWIT